MIDLETCWHGFLEAHGPVLVCDPRRWLGRSVRYLWGFPNQKPVLAVEATPLQWLARGFGGCQGCIKRSEKVWKFKSKSRWFYNLLYIDLWYHNLTFNTIFPSIFSSASLSLQVYPPISAMLKLSFVGVHNLAPWHRRFVLRGIVTPGMEDL